MRFSITVPAFKATYLKECIDSVLRQTYEDFELIIVNDASPEDLTSIVKSFNDPRIRYYINEKNCGAINVVDNWNKCLSYATGEYIICMGDDDKLLPNCLEEYVKLINKYPNLGVYHAWTETIDENSNFINITVARPEYESVYSLIWHRWYARHQQFIGDFLFETELLRENGGFFKLPLAWASDNISVNIAAKKNGIANTQVITFQYRINQSSISSTGNVIVKMDAIKQEKKWYNSFLSSNIPTNTFDQKLRIILLTNLDTHFLKHYVSMITSDIATHSLFRIFYWIKQRKKYDIPWIIYGKILIDSIEKLSIIKKRFYEKTRISPTSA